MGVTLVAMGIAALFSPAWGAFALIGGTRVLRGRPSGKGLLLATGAILILVNLLYLVAILAEPEATNKTAFKTFAGVAVFFAGRAAFGGYLVLAGRLG